MKVESSPTEVVAPPPPEVVEGEAVDVDAVEEVAEPEVVEDAPSSDKSEELVAPQRCWSTAGLGCPLEDTSSRGQTSRRAG